ncbi:MAG: glycosyltransferase family 39 protein [Chloroflexi bacterium]|nr:glycosyltransferase family 39 protein [Chloroflexota bacterium]
MTARRVLINVVLVVWLVVVQLAYYRVHKPAEPGDLAGLNTARALLARPWDGAALLGPLGDLAVACGLMALAWLLGRAVLRALPVRLDGSPAEHGVVAAAVGLGGLSLVVLALTALGWFTLPVVLMLGAGGAAALLAAEGYAVRKRGVDRGLLPLRFSLLRGRGENVLLIPVRGKGTAGEEPRRFPQVLRRPRPLLSTAHALPGNDLGLGPWVSALLAGYLVLALALALLRALAPPIGWDSLVYHLTGPRLWVATGRMVGGIDLPHYYFPPLVELLYALALLLRSDTAAQALHTALAGLTVLMTGLTARRFLGPGYGLPAAALLLSGTSLVALAGRAYVEWGLMLFVVLAVWALGRWREEGGAAWLALAGGFLGLGLGVKYTAVAVAAGAAVFVAGVGLIARSPARVVLGRLALLGLAAGLVAAPWYLRTLALTGNPVYPFVFGGWNWDAWKAAWFSRPGTGLLQDPWRILLAPWELTVLGVEGGLTYDGTIGPMFLILLPLLALLPRPPLVRLCLVVAGVAYVFWLLGAASSSLLQQPRLLYPVFPLLALLGAWSLLGARAWALPAFRPRRLLVASLLLSLGLALFSLLTRFAADLPLAYLVGAESRSEYLARHLGGYYSLVSRLDRVAGPEARVLFLWEPRTYLCPVACQPDGLLFNWRFALHRYGEVAAIQRAWVAAGYTHVLLHGAGLRYFLDLDNGEVAAPHVAALQELEARSLERLEGPTVAEAMNGEGARYTLYRLRREP